MRRTILLVRFALIVLLAVSLSYTVFEVPLAVSQEVTIVSKRFSGPVPILDPNSDLWKDVSAVEIPLSPQVTAPPMLLTPNIRSVKVRSMNNGSWAAFMLEWRDSTKNMSTLRVGEYRDAVAIQFPLKSEQPFICMGQLGNTVQILHWKADWQQDVEGYYREMKDAYPNIFVDLYPFATGKPPYSTVPVANVSRTYVAGWAAGNPFSDPLKLTPVEDLVAGGFGTLTSQPQQDAIGRGVWETGTWRTVLSRPMTTSDPNDAVLVAGKASPVAFAVWDGGNKEVDGKKSVSSWVVVNFEGPTLAGAGFAPTIWQLAGIGGIWALSIAILLYMGRGRGVRVGSK